MIKVFEYACPIHGTFEKFQPTPADTFECATCGQPSERRISAVRSKLEGVTGDFPTAADKWARLHIEAGQKK